MVTEVGVVLFTIRVKITATKKGEQVVNNNGVCFSDDLQRISCTA